ncbi:MAG: hypothetical protein ABS41_08390 [Arenimonas sp. SCN 70-307]|uniref:hypothetical protein n=1 Tax=Arenimonas sp. SCN 70-307 TaxID=1660089 RepID=UPI00086D1E99|nr:hypothetical protein [Arenimonas sp. SCN 70-307]ODS63169.1 MAG: hypothetical protein ABS41_08390 [Arenimonas sp. SCN 70-307]
MKLKSQQDPIDMQACREVWRLRELGCSGSPVVQAVMLWAVAKAIMRPIETMPRPELDQLWQAFKGAINCKAIRLTDLPLPLLSFGERFALAVGALFNADHLPTGETFLELVDSATGSGTEQAGMFALSAILGLPTVQAVLPAETLAFHGAEPARDYSDDEVIARAREAMDSCAV